MRRVSRWCTVKDRNLLDWGIMKKVFNLTIVSILAFRTPLESSVIAPAVPILKSSFHKRRASVTSLVVSFFALGFAFASLLLFPLSDLCDRRLLYYPTNLVTLASFVAWAPASDTPSFIVLRVD